VRVTRGDDIGTLPVNLGVDDECCAIDVVLAYEYLTFVVDHNEIRDSDLAEIHSEGVDPKVMGIDRVAYRDMACNSFVEAEVSEESKSRCQAFKSMLPFLKRIVERWRCRKR
jgi:hypothetical protein